MSGENGRGGTDVPGPAVVLARQLVAQLEREGAERREILLDLTVGGIRCLVGKAPSPDAASSLSPRETEIVRMVAKGYPTKAIADVLEISFYTVSSHIRRIFTKLEVNSRAEMVAAALRNRLLPVEDP